jgi:AraC-like DNA-binding protein
VPSSDKAPSGLVTALREAGVDLVAAALAAGIDATRLDELPRSHAGALLDAVFERDSDPTLGIRIGERVKPELCGVVGLAALSAPTYGSALARCARYKRLLTDLRIDIVRGPKAALRVHLPASAARARSARAQIEAELVFFVRFGRDQARPPVVPLEIRLRTSRPPRPAAYERIFGCPVRFGQSSDEICLSPEALDRPLLGADCEVYALLSRTADRRLDELSHDLLARARAHIERLLPEGEVSLDHVALALATSRRTLQRALRAADTTYTGLVDETRHQLARRYLEDGRFDALDVSFLVGFSHPNSFYRAFRRWTGRSPESYRREPERSAASRRRRA